ncbi:MAG TPA: adenosylcobalamin-dependent ribonucleoside-diphosphate reductase, partial [Phycisphaerae bacterium]|nr:adenosylcobalamin-dependent ribonucleoside-diphosphate reductase [Phycisphaerae bacterium]
MLSSSHARAPAEDVRLTENARKVLEARYLKKNEAGECIEAPADLFRRVARCVADVELRYGACESDRQLWENRYYELMTNGAFMPNSPTLMNAGREMGMLSACFVLPVRDSINDIFDSIKHTALIQKAGGGTGFAFDELRPTGDYIASSGGTTSGPISFWRAFSEATNAIQQGAFRRGANMGMMYVHHPDILKFLHAKQDLNQFTNYNISVKMTDAWMDEFLADPDSPHVCRNPRTGQAYLLPRELDIWKYDVRSLIEIDCVEPIEEDSRQTYCNTPLLVGDIPEELRGKVYTKRDIWNIIIQNAWQTGEPGVVFMDRINENNPTPHVGRIEATNPCGEQPLLPYEACNLGSINLGLFILDACTPDARVDWDGLRDAIHLSTRYLDNVIDANNYPLPEIDAVCKANRKIGLGVMGFADALYRLNVAYNSDEGVQWGERFGQFVNDEAHNCSEQLARERGSFPNWPGSIWDTLHHRPMRNACSTTVAPTGTISIIANCSGGIEPMFSLAFIRNVLRGQKQGEKPLIEVNETFREVARRRGILSDELLERLATEGTLAHIEEVPEDLKRVFVCAHDITPEWHMQMQAAFQRHNDSSISKTINFPHSATPGQVEVIYRLAYELRCKGVTVYRDGCRSFQPMALKKSAEATERRSDGVEATEARRQEGEGAEAGRAGETKQGPGIGGSTDQRSEGPGDRGIEVEDSKIDESPDHAIKAADKDMTGKSVAPAEPGHGRMREFLPTIAKDAARAASGTPATRASFPSVPRSLDPAVPPFVAAPLRPSVPVPIIEPIDLPEILSSFRMRQMTPFGNMHIHITVDPRSGRELEVFAQLGKGGDVA